MSRTCRANCGFKPELTFFCHQLGLLLAENGRDECAMGRLSIFYFGTK